MKCKILMFLRHFFQGVLSFMELHNFFLNGVLYPGFINALKLLAAEKGKVCSQMTCFLLTTDLICHYQLIC